MATWEFGERWGAALALTLSAFACSSGGGASGEGGAAAQGAGGSSSSSSSSSATAVASSSSAAVGTGGFGGGPAAFVCDPPAEPGSFYEHSADSYDINDLDAVSMCKYRGKVLLVVNTAAS
jgi:hypothetical protein